LRGRHRVRGHFGQAAQEVCTIDREVPSRIRSEVDAKDVRGRSRHAQERCGIETRRSVGLEQIAEQVEHRDAAEEPLVEADILDLGSEGLQARGE